MLDLDFEIVDNPNRLELDLDSVVAKVKLTTTLTDWYQIWTNVQVQWNLALMTLLVSCKTVTKSRFVTKFIAPAYGVSINLYYLVDYTWNYIDILELLMFMSNVSW